MSRPRGTGGAATAQLPLGVQLRSECRLDNYVAGEGAAATQALGGLLRDGAERRVFLVGPEASGKTHLLQAACREWAASGRPVAYVPLRQRAGFAPALMAGLESLDLVCVDDVDCVAGEASWERAVFNLFNEVDARGGRLLMAARNGPSVLGLQDLVSRLEAMLRIPVEAPDDERRARILGERARDLGFSLPGEVVRYLLEHRARDLHSLMATLAGIDRFALATQRRVTLPLVLDYLRRPAG